MKKLLLGLLCFICMPFIQVSATDSPLWNHEITLGYGYAREIFYPVHNSGFVSSVMLHRFGMWGKTLNFSLNGTAAYWMADTTENKDMPAVALNLAMRGYFNNPYTSTFRPYFLATIGPAYVFEKKFGDNELGTNFALQISMGAGFEYGKPDHAFELNWQLYHYCDAGFASPNRGTNILFVLSAGYVF